MFGHYNTGKKSLKNNKRTKSSSHLCRKFFLGGTKAHVTILPQLSIQQEETQHVFTRHYKNIGPSITTPFFCFFFTSKRIQSTGIRGHLVNSVKSTIQGSAEYLGVPYLFLTETSKNSEQLSAEWRLS